MFIDMLRWNDGADWADMKSIFSRMPLIPQIFLRCWLQLFPLPEPRKAQIPAIPSILSLNGYADDWESLSWLLTYLLLFTNLTSKPSFCNMGLLVKGAFIEIGSSPA